MSRWTSLPTLALAATLLLAGCATTGLSDSQRLALYRAHAGAPQKDLSNADRLIGWTALGMRPWRSGPAPTRPICWIWATAATG